MNIYSIFWLVLVTNKWYSLILHLKKTIQSISVGQVDFPLQFFKHFDYSILINFFLLDFDSPSVLAAPCSLPTSFHHKRSFLACPNNFQLDGYEEHLVGFHPSLRKQFHYHAETLTNSRKIEIENFYVFGHNIWTNWDTETYYISK